MVLNELLAWPPLMLPVIFIHFDLIAISSIRGEHTVNAAHRKSRGIFPKVLNTVRHLKHSCSEELFIKHSSILEGEYNCPCREP